MNSERTDHFPDGYVDVKGEDENAGYRQGFCK